MDSSSETKTVVLGNDRRPTSASAGNCPVCNALLQTASDSGILLCPACGYSKKISFSFEPGCVIRGKYRLLSSLNKGGFGDIYLCCPLDNAAVRYVVKVLRNAALPGAQPRFTREAKILQSMKNDRIVQLIDYWTDSSGSYMVLEYVDGKNLRDLRKEFEFGEETTLMIVREVAYALKYALENFSVIHRDIKPENIMLNQKNHIKVLDFGLSKDTASGTQTDITMENSGLGTPGYMSPEQFRNFKHVDFRSDIYSIGATMFLLLTGEHLFSGDNAQEIYKNTMLNSPPTAEKFKDCCSKGCIRLVQWMMQTNPEKRPASYDEVIDAVNRLLEP